MTMTPPPDLRSCPKCGWAGETREAFCGDITEDLWYGPVYIPRNTIKGNLEAVVQIIEEHLRWRCSRCDYPVVMPCDTSSTIPLASSE